MQRMTMRVFRASIAHIDEPVLVGEGIWFPSSTPILEAIGDGTAVLGLDAHINVQDDGDERLVLVIEKEQANGAA